MPTSSSAADIGDIIEEMEQTRFAEVVSAVRLPIAWPGLVAPEDDLQGQVTAQIGRWCLTPHGIACVGEGYWITTDRLDEEDWLDHLLQKDWLYDPSDLLRALEQARAEAFPTVERAQHQATIDAQLPDAITDGQLVFHPTTLRHDHVYLALRMIPDERVAFCAFLADEGFVARAW